MPPKHTPPFIPTASDGVFRRRGIKPRVLIFSGYGLNCEEETKHAFEIAGAVADIIHLNDLIENSKKIHRYQIIVFPGGFAYGDDTGSGKAYANKVRNHLWEEILLFIQKDTLVLGVCNGFQIVVSLGLLPGFNNEFGKIQLALLHNESARYTARWVDVESRNSSPWLANIRSLSLPIAHGEGKLYADKKALAALIDQKHVALNYIYGNICAYQNLPENPTGTLENIAGLTDLSGKIFGLMPHPERAIYFTQLPNWTYLKEVYLRENKKLPTYGSGLAIFQNGTNYFS